MLEQDSTEFPRSEQIKDREPTIIFMCVRNISTSSVEVIYSCRPATLCFPLNKKLFRSLVGNTLQLKEEKQEPCNNQLFIITL